MLSIYQIGFVQDYINSIANTLELLQSCTKPSIWDTLFFMETWSGTHSDQIFL